MQTVGLKIKAAKPEVKPEVKEDFKPEVDEMKEAPKTTNKNLKDKKAAK